MLNFEGRSSSGSSTDAFGSSSSKDDPAARLRASFENDSDSSDGNSKIIASMNSGADKSQKPKRPKRVKPAAKKSKKK